MNLVEIADLDKKHWEELVEVSPVASWFQTWEAYEFFDSLSVVDVFGFAVENLGRVTGLVIGYIQKDGGKLKQFFSKRAIVLGGPLLSENITNEELKTLLYNVREHLRKEAIYIETRNFSNYNRWKKTFEECGFEYEPHYDILVDTSSMESVNEHLGKSRKRDIRVSQRDGASVVFNPTWDQVRAFYGILEELYLKKVKTPLFPIEFFEKLFALSSSVFLLVEYKGEIVGGTVCVGLKGKVLHEMYVCGKDGIYKNIFPSELATFMGLQYAAENDYQCFDMMGAGKPDDGGYGVRDFKLKFGGELVEFGRFNYVCNSLLFQIGKLGVKLMKKL